LFTYFEQDLFAPAFSVISWWVLIFSQGLIWLCGCFYRGMWIVSK
jgi:hypothetical protein